MDIKKTIINFKEKMLALYHTHKKHIAMGGIAVLALSIPVVIAQVLKQQDLRQHAAVGSAVTLSFSPSSGNKQINDVFDVQLLIATDVNDISAIDGYLKYYDSLLELQSVTASSPYVKIDRSAESYGTAPSVKVQRIILYNPTQSVVTGPSKTLVTFRFKALANGSAAVGFYSDPRGDSTKILKIAASGFSGNVPLSTASGPTATFAIGISTVHSATPVTVTGITTATQVAAGVGHTCSVLADSTVKCWGNNGLGQLGNGTTTNSSTPVTVTGITTATQVAAGNNHTCARLTDSTVKCWGNNGFGQLGNGTTTNSSTPVAVTGITTATQVTAGTDHTCARLSDSTIKCWGLNDAGQLGNGTTTNSSTPVAVSGITTATLVAAGQAYVCTRLSDSTVKCWGNNNASQLGNGSTTNSSTPVSVTGVTTAMDVAAGNEHTCVRLTDITVKCWGDNGFGQLGNGTRTNSSTPVVVTGITTATQIAARNAHACVRLSDSTVKCWGSNYSGQLGDGSTTDSSTPVVVSGINTATQVAAGMAHTCARLSDSTIKCWGLNDAGQLGNGTSSNVTPTVTSTPTVTAVPSPTITITPTPTVMPTLPTTTPIPTPVIAEGSTALKMSLSLPGIGTKFNGDNAAPRRTTRIATAIVYDSSNTAVTTEKSGVLIYNTANGRYEGKISLGESIATPSGGYIVKVKMDNTLYKRLSGIVTITKASQENTTPTAELVAGDITGPENKSDNTISILDYNLLQSCYRGQAACTTSVAQLSDFNDDGIVRGDDVDANILARGFYTRNGD